MISTIGQIIQALSAINKYFILTLLTAAVFIFILQLMSSITGHNILERLQSHLREKGRITFEEFMDIALYHPEFGYYTSERARIGKEGDYYTSTDVHKAFGSCIMRQVEEMWGILGSSSLNLIEVGAGKGLLCADILISAREKSPPLFDSLRYFIVEKSTDFIERQKRHIEELGLLDKVFWVSEVKDAIPDGIGIVLSNELIDAFPVHKVRYSNGRWNEIYVTLKEDKLVELEDAPSNQILADFLALSLNPLLQGEGQGEGGFNSRIEDGYTTEVNLRATDWIKGIGDNLQKGFVITIDYGYPRKELYSPERNRGTLMCYHRHQAIEDPYINIGEQDMTTHVDFTSLAEGGTAAGLEVTGFTEQSYFLMGCGIEEEFRQLINFPSPLAGEGEGEGGHGNIDAFINNITLKKLLMPGGMGSTFKVLIQHKGMERPRLRGFSFRDMAKYLL